MKHHRPSLLLLFLLNAAPAFLGAQNNVHWFGDSSSTLINNRIIALKEAPGGGLYLLGKASDANYENVRPYFASCDKTGKLQSQKTLENTNKVYELNNFLVCGTDKFRIWGTEVVNDRPTLMLNTINAKGELQGSDAILTNTATFCGDVCQASTATAVVAKTVQSSSTGKYHVSLYKYNIQDDQQLWYKTLATEDNEEASKVFLMKDSSVILLAKLYDANLSSYTPLLYKLSPTGEVIWKKEISAYTFFYQQGITESKNKSLVYVCSYGSEKDGTGTTKIFSLDSSGNVLNSTEQTDIRANGILTLQNGNLFVYGAHYQLSGRYEISKATYKMFSPQLDLLNSDEMGMTDGPDAYLPSLAMSVQPTASDFLCAIQLRDGRIACAGRVYMPAETAADKILLSARTNKALLVVMSSDGKIR